MTRKTLTSLRSSTGRSNCARARIDAPKLARASPMIWPFES
ncbi:hypothetical protein WOB59_10360 [Methylocystis sp. IM4]